MYPHLLVKLLRDILSKVGLTEVDGPTSSCLVCTLNLENEKYSIRKLNLSIGGSRFMGNCFVLNITISFLGNKKLKERKRKIK
jgi:hypothetical protein